MGQGGGVSENTDIMTLPAPSRDLDVALHRFLVGTVLSLPSGPIMTGGIPVPRYTKSIDAITSLCESVLTGWNWRISKCSVSDDVCLMPDFNDPVYGVRHREVWTNCVDPLDDGPGLVISFTPSGSPALALCACLMSVLDGIMLKSVPEPGARALNKLNSIATDPQSDACIMRFSLTAVITHRSCHEMELHP